MITSENFAVAFVYAVGNPCDYEPLHMDSQLKIMIRIVKKGWKFG